MDGREGGGRRRLAPGYRVAAALALIALGTAVHQAVAGPSILRPGLQSRGELAYCGVDEQALPIPPEPYPTTVWESLLFATAAVGVGAGLLVGVRAAFGGTPASPIE